MTTNVIVISDSLREIGVIAETQSASAEQGSHALRKLNDMIEAWTEDEIELGYFAQSSTADTCPIPDWALKAVKEGLAIELAPTYGATISRELAEKFRLSYRSVLRKAIVEKMSGADMSHLPRGTGVLGEGAASYDILNDTTESETLWR